MKIPRSVQLIVAFLKVLAFLTMLDAIFSFGSSTSSALSFNNDMVHRVTIFGFPIEMNRTVFQIFDFFSRLLDGAIRSALLWWAAEALRLIVQTEIYARGTYILTRKRSLPPYSSNLEEKVTEPKPKKVRVEGSGPVFEMRAPTPDDLQYSPTERYHRRLRSQGAPTRYVTVFRNRADHAVRPPRPAGQIEVVDALDGDSTHLPFDEV